MHRQATVGCVQPALFLHRQNWPSEKQKGRMARTVSPLFVCYSQLDEGFPENGHPPGLMSKLHSQVSQVTINRLGLSKI